MAEKSKTDSKSPMLLYAVVGIIVIVVVAGLLYWLSVGHGTMSSTSSVSSTVPNLGSSSAGATCPCLSEVQMESVVNDSPAESANSIYNTNSTTNVSDLAQLAPSNFTGSLSKAWEAITATNQTEGVQEIIVQTTNAPGLYDLYVNTSSSLENVSFKSGGAVNGFTYSYLNLTNSTISPTKHVFVLYGYKGGYDVILSYATTNNGTQSVATVASELSSTLGG